MFKVVYKNNLLNLNLNLFLLFSSIFLEKQILLRKIFFLMFIIENGEKNYVSIKLI